MFGGEVNCISYVRHQLGLDEEEVFRYPPFLEALLEDFDVVLESEAQVVAVVRPFGRETIVSHLAILEPDRRTMRHRHDVDTDVSTARYPEGLSDYLIKSPDSKKLYLTPKSKSIK